MIDLKRVAELAKQDAEDREYVTRVFKNAPDSTEKWLAENSIRIMEETTADLAKLAAAADDTNTTH